MAGQNFERREVLRVLAIAAGASTFAGFERWVFAHDHAAVQHSMHGAKKAAKKPYKPQFFSPDEYATVTILAALIIPNDDSPGAREAGVNEFIDFMVASNLGVQYRFRQGLVWMDAHALALYGRSFRELSATQQTEILKHLAYQDSHRPGEESGREFFKLIREYTVMGFYTSRIGLEQLDCPTLRFYKTSPACPHAATDPEHQHLPAPQI
jgi:hypothetical protein